MSQHQTVIILTQEQKGGISYFLGNHGNDCCFHERLNSLYRPASAAEVHHRVVVKPGMWRMLVLNGAITIIVIAVNVKIFGRGNDEFSNVSNTQVLCIHAGNYCWKFYCSFLL